MAKALLVSSLLAGVVGLGVSAHAAPIFPAAGGSTLGPAVTITFTDLGPMITTNSSQTYDGSDDVEVALLNNSSMEQTAITLSGTGNGGGIFAFDGDGISQYTDANTGMLTPGNPADLSGYAGPGVTFSNINSAQDSGTVNFDLAPGAYTYFSLESSPSSINNGGGIVVTPVTPINPVPEPGSLVALGSGVLALLGALRGRVRRAAV